jgi:hypothetical protein
MALLPMGRVPGTSTWWRLARHRSPFKTSEKKGREHLVAIGTRSLGKGSGFPVTEQTGGTALNGKAPEHFVPEEVICLWQPFSPAIRIDQLIDCGGCAHFSSSIVFARYCGGRNSSYKVIERSFRRSKVQGIDHRKFKASSMKFKSSTTLVGVCD